MESSSTEKYIPQKSKKRVFPRTSSFCAEPEVNEKYYKQKEIVNNEMLDGDMDENRHDRMLIDKKAKSNGKGKDVMESTPRTTIQPNSVNGIQSLKKSFASGSDDGGSYFNNGNDYMDVYADDYSFEDEYTVLQSQFDKIEFPSTVEAHVPWFPDSIPVKSKKIAATQTTSATRFVQSTIPASGSQKSHSRKKAQSDKMKVPSVKTPLRAPPCNGASGSESSRSGKKGKKVKSKVGDMKGPGAGPSISHSSRKAKESISAGETSNDDVMKKYENFKKFDVVDDHLGHHYSNQLSSMYKPAGKWAKKIHEEWKILEKGLPDAIFVRVYESKMDLLRAVIVGAEGTPYHDGLFFFDMCFPDDYPQSPPLVHYHARGLRINPNLYECGKVCLSLLGTWHGGSEEQWVPGKSTMLQVLVSIQGLILNAEPYYNEPGVEKSTNASLEYNEDTLILSLKTMVYTMNQPPKHFEDLVIGHFRNRVRDIFMACAAYIDGAQVGSVVKGVVQESDNKRLPPPVSNNNGVASYIKTLVGGVYNFITGTPKEEDAVMADRTPSLDFRIDVASYIPTLVRAFKRIGANEAEEFSILSQTIDSS